mmetsp:Transcript_21895/g.36257  ORF Transcript_21895/g.36257 Transcript_21895/m.36257 type:complete len:434 (-) Transcript_21895:166-1467(-)
MNRPRFNRNEPRLFSSGVRIGGALLLCVFLGCVLWWDARSPNVPPIVITQASFVSSHLSDVPVTSVKCVHVDSVINERFVRNEFPPGGICILQNACLNLTSQTILTTSSLKWGSYFEGLQVLQVSSHAVLPSSWIENPLILVEAQEWGHIPHMAEEILLAWSILLHLDLLVGSTLPGSVLFPKVLNIKVPWVASFFQIVKESAPSLGWSVWEDLRNTFNNSSLVCFRHMVSTPVSKFSLSAADARSVRSTFLRALQLPEVSFAFLKEQENISVTVIDRKGLRGFRNIDELVKALSLQNVRIRVEYMEGKSFKEQAEIWSSSKIVIAAHGASLTNLIFMHRNAGLIEVFPPRYHEPMFVRLSFLLGIIRENIYLEEHQAEVLPCLSQYTNETWSSCMITSHNHDCLTCFRSRRLDADVDKISAALNHILDMQRP